MAVVNTLADQITRRDAGKKVAVDQNGAVLRMKSATLELAAADDDTSVFRLVGLKSHEVVHSILLFCDAITAGTSFDVGLYRTAADGGAVVDADAYGSAVDLSTASKVGIEVAFEARDIANCNKKVFEDAGLSADTGLEYDLALTANTVGSAAGTVSCKVYYTEGNA